MIVLLATWTYRATIYVHTTFVASYVQQEQEREQEEVVLEQLEHA